MNLLETKITLRSAKMWDVFRGKGQKRFGQPFWVKSQQTGKFDNRGYLVEHSTNAKELEKWIELGMLYVPASDLEIQKETKAVPQPAPQPELHLNQ